MDRKPRLVIHPSAMGWTGSLYRGAGEALCREAATIEEAAVVARDAGRLDTTALTLAIPSRWVIFERMSLPSMDQTELAGMIHLQFEKTLPHPVEEMGLGWQVLQRRGSETIVMACAVHEPGLALLFAPLGEPGRLWMLAPWAFHVAAQAADSAVACGLWREGMEVVFGIFQAGRLGYVEPMHDPLGEISRVLLSATLAGCPTHFEKVFVDPSLAEIGGRFSELVHAPLAEWTASGNAALPGEAVDFIPHKWRARMGQRARSRRLRLYAGTAGALYGLTLAGAAISLGVGQRRLAALEAEARALRPSVETLIERQARWNALAPAADPGRSLLEWLYQTCQAFPTPETRLTRLELSGQNQLLIEGEAANARQAIAFAENLKKQPTFGSWHFESGPPVLLNNEHAQFRVLAKP